MCAKCELIEGLVDQINAGTRPIDRELISAMISQWSHVFEEMQTDIASDKPWLQLLEELGETMLKLSLVMRYNTENTVLRAMLAEQMRIANIVRSN
jgi:arsenate reductase-like glutaredoxin family protein